MRDESVAKGDQVTDLRNQMAILEREIETVKIQRAEMWREITRLKELSESKACEANHQHERLHQLEHEIGRTNGRIEDISKVIDARSHDLRNKQIALEDVEREFNRCKDAINKTASENAALRRDNERVAAENYDIRKEVEFQDARNGDLQIQIRDTEVRLKEKEESLFVTRRDIENQRIINN